MATSNSLGTSDAGFIAAGAITQYSFVKINSTNNTVAACTAITDAPDGIAQTAATAAGDHVTVRTINGSISKLRYGATIDSGEELMVKGSGTGEAAVAAGATAFSAAKAIVSGVSGDIGTVIFRPTLKSPANS